jgi:two-component system, chemotaxis family, sensor kinase Cph1
MVGRRLSEDSPFLEHCDQEPIHVPGSIQPHGVLIGFDPESEEIVQLAGDTQAFLGLAPSQILGGGLGPVFGLSQAEQLCALEADDLSLPRSRFPFEMEIMHRGKSFDATVHKSDSLLVVELERAAKRQDFNALARVRSMLIRVQYAKDVSSFLQSAVEEIRAATGFDRVMVYRFQEDESGVVIAEDKAPELEPYLGQHYPASDIPKQARDLYLKNQIRMIPDAGYAPLPIAPALNPVTGRPLDLTFSVLRSVSPVHLEYLANMGAAASTSLSLAIGGRLWGLIACHHRTPRYLSQALRGACELFTQAIALQLGEKLANDCQRERLRMRDVHALLVKAMVGKARPDEALIEGRPNLLDYIPAGGAAVFWEGVWTTAGRTPTPQQLAALVEWLNASVNDPVFATDCLAAHYPPAKDYADAASGLLAISLSRSPRDCLLWFRPELRHTVTWAGNPSTPVHIADDGVRIGPRKSFAAWRETVSGRSSPWDAVTLETAAEFRASILEIVLRHLDQVLEERERNRGQQDLLMAELHHRVKNTLAITKALVGQSSTTATDVGVYKEGILERLDALARAHDLLTRNRWEGVDLRDLAAEQSALFAGRFSVAGPKFMLKPAAALGMALALHELTTNAAKYGALSTDAGRVDVSWTFENRDGEGWLIVRWVERAGPRVEPPSRIGFGKTLLERTLAYGLGGTVDFDFQAEGLVCAIELPFAAIAGA